MVLTSRNFLLGSTIRSEARARTCTSYGSPSRLSFPQLEILDIDISCWRPGLRFLSLSTLASSRVHTSAGLSCHRPQLGPGSPGRVHLSVHTPPSGRVGRRMARLQRLVPRLSSPLQRLVLDWGQEAFEMASSLGVRIHQGLPLLRPCHLLGSESPQGQARTICNGRKHTAAATLSKRCKLSNE